MPTDPWALAYRPASSPTLTGRSLGTAVAAVACATLASLVVGVPGAAGAALGAPTATARILSSSSSAQGATVDVLVQGHPGALHQVVAAVGAVGGTVATELAVLDGVRATVPALGQAALRAAPGVRDVTVDSSLVPLDASWGDDSTGEGFIL